MNRRLGPLVWAARGRLLPCALVLAAGAAVWLAHPRQANAHCDTMDGPVVMEAKKALAAGDVTPVLKWVKAEHEEEIRAVFRHVLAVRKLGGEAKELADRYLFETLVRLHRAGEGAPYSGLKPAGSELSPAVVAADKALETGSVDALVETVRRHAERGIRERFQRALETKKDADGSVGAGREYVEAYVEFVHYVERLHNDISTSTAHAAEVEGAAAGALHEH